VYGKGVATGKAEGGRALDNGEVEGMGQSQKRRTGQMEKGTVSTHHEKFFKILMFSTNFKAVEGHKNQQMWSWQVLE